MKRHVHTHKPAFDAQLRMSLQRYVHKEPQTHKEHSTERKTHTHTNAVDTQSTETHI